MPVHIGFEAWDATDRKFDARALLKWSGWTSEEIMEEARRLLFRAWSIDPLRDWVDLVRFCRLLAMEEAPRRCPPGNRAPDRCRDAAALP